MLFSSYRPEMTTTKSLPLTALKALHLVLSYEAFRCENPYFLSEFSVSGKASSSFSVPSKIVAGLLYSKVYFMGVGAYLFGEGYPSPMFQSGVKSFTNVSARKMILHQ